LSSAARSGADQFAVILGHDQRIRLTPHPLTTPHAIGFAGPGRRPLTWAPVENGDSAAARAAMMVLHARRVLRRGCDLVACGAREQRGVVIFGGISVGDAVLLLAAGVLAGMVGSAGGIASLISYPVLLAVGIPPLPANVADTVAFVASLPGSALGSRPELRGQGRRVVRLAPLAVAGSSVGAVLLLLTPAGVFARIVPFLVAFAALALLVQPRLSAWLEKHPGKNTRLLAPCGLLAVWIFDGYWGVGAGVMALAVLTLAVETHLARANALKNVLLGVADAACSIVFVLYGPVRWAAVVPLALGVLAGSRAGPSLTRQVPAGLLRIGVALAGLALAVHLWLSPG
jgi:uncharacterized protein